MPELRIQPSVQVALLSHEPLREFQGWYTVNGMVDFCARSKRNEEEDKQIHVTGDKFTS